MVKVLLQADAQGAWLSPWAELKDTINQNTLTDKGWCGPCHEVK